MKRAKLLAHDWSLGRLATAHSIEELFSSTMASRFEYIEELMEKSENENTKNNTEW